MTLFILMSLLLVVVLLALALKPLWTRQRRLAGILLLGSALSIGGLYWLIGRPEAIGYKAPQAAEQTIEQALAELETIVREQPTNLEARVLLARSYLQTGKPEAAQPYFAEALKLAPDNTGLMVDYAESIFRAGKPDVPDPRAREWLDKALAAEPDNQRALFYSGILLLQAGKPKDAAAVWEDEAHVIENRALYAEKFEISDRIFGNVAGYISPEAGFFLWLPVEDDEAAAVKLWRETGVKVLPGGYLAQDVAGVENPGKKYIRAALVAPKDETERGLQAIRDCLYPV